MKPLVFLALAAVALAAEPDPDVIVSKYREAHRAKDLDGLMALVEFSPTTPPEIRELWTMSFRTQLSFVIMDVNVLPLDDEDRKTLAALLLQFDATLTPVAKLVTRFDETKQAGPAKNGQVTSFLGLKDGMYRITTSKKKEEAKEGRSSNPR